MNAESGDHITTKNKFFLLAVFEIIRMIIGANYFKGRKFRGYKLSRG